MMNITWRFQCCMALLSPALDAAGKDDDGHHFKTRVMVIIGIKWESRARVDYIWSYNNVTVLPDTDVECPWGTFWTFSQSDQSKGSPRGNNNPNISYIFTHLRA